MLAVLPMRVCIHRHIFIKYCDMYVRGAAGRRSSRCMLGWDKVGISQLQYVGCFRQLLVLLCFLAIAMPGVPASGPQALKC
jgi:hypothetical protein